MPFVPPEEVINPREWLRIGYVETWDLSNVQSRRPDPEFGTLPRNIPLTWSFQPEGERMVAVQDYTGFIARGGGDIRDLGGYPIDSIYAFKTVRAFRCSNEASPYYHLLTSLMEVIETDIRTWYPCLERCMNILQRPSPLTDKDREVMERCLESIAIWFGGIAKILQRQKEDLGSKGKKERYIKDGEKLRLSLNHFDDFKKDNERLIGIAADDLRSKSDSAAAFKAVVSLLPDFAQELKEHRKDTENLFL